MLRIVHSGYRYIGTGWAGLLVAARAHAATREWVISTVPKYHLHLQPSVTGDAVLSMLLVQRGNLLLDRSDLVEDKVELLVYGTTAFAFAGRGRGNLGSR